jgi:hypothetical protein
MSTEILHVYNDGSKLVRMSVHTLLATPIWCGNRIIDMAHVQAIKDAITADDTSVRSLDSGYKIITFTEDDAAGKPVEARRIIDGQHRVEVIRGLLQLCDDFTVTATIKNVESESDAVDYFNKINNSKPIHYEEDPKLVVQRYMKALDESFPKKAKFFREAKTRRPYVQKAELIDALVKHANQLRKIKPDAFAKHVVNWNVRHLEEIKLEPAIVKVVKDAGIKTHAVEIKFALGLDTRFKWIEEVLKVK